MIETITIGGFRGFGKEQTISFAMPDKEKAGSGLTFVVGANNTGKTTITEAIRSFNCLNSSQAPTFSSDKRNRKYNDGKILLQLKDENGKVYTIRTVNAGGSMTELISPDDLTWNSQAIYVLNSRRSIQPEFSRFEQGKLDYLNNQLINQASRNPYLQDFGARLIAMNKPENRKLINPMLQSILGMDLEWTIDENINRNCYLIIKSNGIEHISEGMGDGLWSVFTICDSLYDLKEGQTLIIDEPELSLHPAYQKRVMKLLKKVAKDHQIIICTHSPYFIDSECLVNGAALIRTNKNAEGDIEVYTLRNSQYIKGLINDLNQPHTFGIEAKEIFFQEDCIIVTEGQEDVVFYDKVSNDLDIDLNGKFFGWGAGGATKIPQVLTILNQLGYKKVAAIFDGDKKDEYERTSKEFPMYGIFIISQEDIRDKPTVKAKESKNGLCTRDGRVKEEYQAEMKGLFEQLNSYFSS